MWKLKNITAKNICAFRELDYDIEQGATTLIFGDNRDNESQRSNGSGKSALIECIAIGLTGSPLRKIKNEEIVNDAADQCEISLKLANDASSEVFYVDRVILRKGSSQVRCRIERDGVPVTTDEAVQPSVDSYNKYILEKLGLSRDEVLNNFILSKYRYQEFLSCSDREKKEIINRFSNGNLVDQAIELIETDMEPIQKELHEMDYQLAGLNGRIEMLTEQLQQEKDTHNQKQLSLQEKLDGLAATIHSKQTSIIVNRKEIESNDNQIRVYELMGIELEKIEYSGKDLQAALPQVIKIMEHIPGAMDHWSFRLDSHRQKVAEAQAEIKKWDVLIGQAQQKVGRVTSEYVKTEKEHQIFMGEFQSIKNEWAEELCINEQNGVQLEAKRSDIIGQQHKLSLQIEEFERKIAGSISCPACSHIFLASDKSYNVSEARKRLEMAKVDYLKLDDRIAELSLEAEKNGQIRTHITLELKTLEDRHDQHNQRLQIAKRNKDAAEYEVEGLQFNRKRVADFLGDRNNELCKMHRDMFDEAKETVDEKIQFHTKRNSSLNEEINAAALSIETLEHTAEELRNSTTVQLVQSLENSLRLYREESSKILLKRGCREKEFGNLSNQQAYFNQFKTYLANTKIEALSKVTNEFLENIGSDIRIRFLGYTILKTGKVREKISVSLIRDGLDCGSFGKFSAGEAARVNLATILAMQKLINANCDDEKGLELLVLDEILEAVDEDGLTAMFGALNALNMTALVVSHGNIAESYPYKVKIIKENGESRIAG